MAVSLSEYVYQQLKAERDALDNAALLAAYQGCGVRVNRYGLDRMTITVDPDVPAGEIHEHWSASPVVLHCDTCSGTGWIKQEPQIGVPGSGCTHGCPDCETGRERLVRGELLESWELS